LVCLKVVASMPPNDYLARNATLYFEKVLRAAGL
jgi:hypothetical protein